MASITQKTKDGKVTSYKFRTCVGRDEFGKQVFRCTTWKAPDGMMPSRAEKAAQRAANEWEKQARDEYRKDLQNPERIKERQTVKDGRIMIFCFRRTEYQTIPVTLISLHGE